MMNGRRQAACIAAVIVCLVFGGRGVATAAQAPVDLLITGGLVVTMDGQMTLIEDGGLAVDKGEIVAVGPSGDLRQGYQATETIDAAGKIIMPGLVNTHTHAAMTLFRGMADDLPLDTWLQKHIWPAEAKFINAASVRTGTDLALVEMIRSGTTTFTDMYFFAGEIAQAAKKAGVRAVVGEAVIDFPTPDSKGPQDSFAIIAGLAAKWRNDPLITIAVAPHAPYTCSPETLTASKTLAGKLALPLMIHVAETEKEIGEVAAKYGVTPFQHLNNLGFFGGTVIVAHAVHPSPGDLGLMAGKKLGVAHNPSSNMKLASGVAPVPEMLRAGIAVGLGTDGAASNNSLSIFKEMNAAALMHKVSRRDPTVFSATEAVTAATIGGARVLGMEQRIGSLTKGKRADIILVDQDRANMVPMYNVYSHLVYAAGGADVDTVVVDGRIVMRRGKLLTLAEGEVLAAAQFLAAKIRDEQRPLK